MLKKEFINCFSKTIHPLVNKYLSQRNDKNVFVQSITYKKNTLSIHLRFYKKCLSVKLSDMFVVTFNSLVLRDIK